MRGTLQKFLAWGRLTFGTAGFPVLIGVALFAIPTVIVACGDTGPSPVADYPPEDAGSTEEPTTTTDAGEDAGEDGGATDDAGEDAGDAGDGGDAAR